LTSIIPINLLSDTKNYPSCKISEYLIYSIAKELSLGVYEVCIKIFPIELSILEKKHLFYDILMSLVIILNWFIFPSVLIKKTWRGVRTAVMY
jgi:hypothetical protein